jgi:hypothetical protein
VPKKHLRPTQEFTVTSVAWDRDNERIHRNAGFDPIPDEVLLRRFWQFLRFLQTHGLTTRTLCKSIHELSNDTVLRNSDLTDEGFYFIQRFHGRWLNRTRKDRGEEKEEAFLVKWYDQFLVQSEIG